MHSSQLRLLRSGRLLGLFVTQFLGALNDNLLKNALVIEIAYRGQMSAASLQILVTVATGVFILPYFLFSATGGQLADKVEKARLIRILKLWEIVIMAVAALGFAVGGIGVAFLVLFLLGVQATLFGPVKYGILPELLAPADLLSGNAVIEAGTFVAILIGTIAGGLLILAPHGDALVAGSLLIFAAGGCVASFFIPRLPPASPDLAINFNIAAETWEVLRYAARTRRLKWTIFGNSWFWFVGVAVVSQFPNYAKDVLDANNQVVTLFLTVNSLGVGAGSMLAGRILSGRLTAKLVPFSAVVMAVFAFDLWLIDGAGGGTGLVGVASFVGTGQHWRIAFDLFALAVGAGLFVVPLYAIMQAEAEASHRARVVAANNVWNALFMVTAGIVSAAMLKLGAGITDIFLAIGIANGIVAAACWRLRR